MARDVRELTEYALSYESDCIVRRSGHVTMATLPFQAFYSCNTPLPAPESVRLNHLPSKHIIENIMAWLHSEIENDLCGR